MPTFAMVHERGTINILHACNTHSNNWNDDKDTDIVQAVDGGYSVYADRRPAQ